MLSQIWSDKKVLAHALGAELASVGFFLEEDTASQATPNAFQLTINIRVLGVQIGATTIKPLANGPFSIPLLAQIGGQVDGRIDNWRGLDQNGAQVNAPGWPGVASVGFTVTALAKVDVSFAALAVPTSWALKIALKALGSPKVTIDIGHSDVVAHVFHAGAGVAAGA